MSALRQSGSREFFLQRIAACCLLNNYSFFALKLVLTEKRKEVRLQGLTNLQILSNG